jgi:hypothetical protein
MKALPRHDVARGGRQTPWFTRQVTLHIYVPVWRLGNLSLGLPLEGLKATKEIGAERRWAPMALISGAEPHDHLSLCSSHLLRSLSG